MAKKEFSYILLFIVAVIGALPLHAQDNDKILNRQYADLKKIHFGFSVGTHFQDLQFTHNGYVSDAGETWFMEIPSFSPGFNVSMLADLRISKHLNLRLSPGMYFGNKVVKMFDTTNKAETQQNVKTNYIMVPLELKISAERYRNLRPYALAGIMGSLDVSKKKIDMLRFKSTDFFITLGMGCDFYLPFFKFCPEIKYCFGLTDALQHNRPDLSDDPTAMKYTNSLKKAVQQMLVISFYFE